MGSLYVGGRWCPNCSAEYRPGFVECPDCLVALVDEEPPRRRRGEDGRDHTEVECALGHWTEDQRDALGLFLRGREIPARWESGTTLVFPRVQEDEVRSLIASIEGTDVDAADESPAELEPIEETAGHADDNAGSVAGPLRRLAGYIVDTLLSSVLLGVLYRATHAHGFVPTWLRLTTLAIVAAYEIVGVAVWGRTVGKLVARTVVVTGDGEVPGFGRALVRWAVQSLGLATAPLGWAAPFAGLVVEIVVYVGLFTSPMRQGLHDRAAGTVVLRAD